LTAFVLSAMGATILIVWPMTGPSAWLRENVLRKVLPANVAEVLDCYVCMSFWMGLLMGALWWWWTDNVMYWLGCLMTPTLFWIVLTSSTSSTDADGNDEVNNVRASDDEP